MTTQAQRARTKLARLTRIYGSDHPSVRAAKAELAAAHLTAAARQFRAAGLTLRRLPRADRMKMATNLRQASMMTADEAVEYMRDRVWPLIDQDQGGHEFSAEEFESVIRPVWREYPGPGGVTT